MTPHIFWREECNNWNIDWSNHPPSADQQRINNYLTNCVRINKKLLHVGVGNSSIATTFFDFLLIDGITVLDTEVQQAKKLNIQNYSVYHCNKYTSQILNLPNTYDYIIDNNIFSFSTCEICNINILNFYTKLLTKNGIIITDIQGLKWKILNGISYDLIQLEKAITNWKLPFVVITVDSYTVILKINE
jgi:hypothetical protein